MVKYTGLASGAGWTLLAIYAHYSGMTIGDRLLWGIPILAATLPQSVEWIHRMRSAIWYWRALRREDTDFWQRYTELETQYPDMPQWKLINTSRDEEEWHQMITVDWQVVTTKPGTDGEIDVTGRRHIQTVEQRECMADFLPDASEIVYDDDASEEDISPLSESDLVTCASAFTSARNIQRRYEEGMAAAQAEIRESRDLHEPGSAQWLKLERMAEDLPSFVEEEGEAPDTPPAL